MKWVAVSVDFQNVLIRDELQKLYTRSLFLGYLLFESLQLLPVILACFAVSIWRHVTVERVQEIVWPKVCDVPLAVFLDPADVTR